MNLGGMRGLDSVAQNNLPSNLKGLNASLTTFKENK